MSAFSVKKLEAASPSQPSKQSDGNASSNSPNNNQSILSNVNVGGNFTIGNITQTSNTGATPPPNPSNVTIDNRTININRGNYNENIDGDYIFLTDNNDELYLFLLWINQKSCLLNSPFDLTTTRAFYLDLALHIDSTIENLQPNPLVAFFSENFNPKLSVSLGFNVNTNLYRISDIYLDMELACAFCDAPRKVNINNFEIEEELTDLLKQLENEILDYHKSYLFPGICEDNSWQSMWQNKVKILAEQLRIKLIEDRNLGHQWKFDLRQKERIEKYYYTNTLLVECLNGSCTVRNELKKQIKETLLLPIAEIEKRKQSNS